MNTSENQKKMVRKPNARKTNIPCANRPSSQSSNVCRVRKQSDKQYFEPFWEEEAISLGLSSGWLVTGKLRINPKQYQDAYVGHPNGDADIYIPGTKSRNRSLNGDLVVVCLEPLKNWKVYDSFLSPKLRETLSDKQENCKNKSVYITVYEFFCQDLEGFKKLFANIPNFLTDKFEDFNDPINISDKSKTSTMPATVQLSWWQIIQRVGRVVAIRRQLNCRVCVGTLQCIPTEKSRDLVQPVDNEETVIAEWNFARFIPSDSRMPRMIIPKAACPQDFVRQPQTFKYVRFVARLTEWPKESLYPKGELVRRFADDTMNYIEAETERILVNTGFAYGLDEATHFPEAVETHIKKLLSAPNNLKKGSSKRRNFRNQCVFTIDPRTARDLDDALHIRRLPKSSGDTSTKSSMPVYEVGVHIADVSFYVRPDDPVDTEAAMRATSIYLVQLCIPMLPRALCEDLCSLHPGADKFTFSVVFTLDEEANILNTWFGRSVIHSRAKLSYEDAQGFLDDPDRDWKASDLPTLESGADIKEICQSVLLLNELAVKMRQRRFKCGALQLNQVKPKFTLAETTGLPIGLEPAITFPANKLVEEWMLAANEAVATLIASRLPRTAFLRRHPAPTRRQLEEAHTILDFSGVKVNITSAATIQRSLETLSGCQTGTGWQYSNNLAELCTSMLDCKLVSGGCAKTSDEKEKFQDLMAKESQMLTVLHLLTKCMNLAEYFCLGAEDYRASSTNATVNTWHYALNVSNYTHFTSPIRRYADIIVHRQLAQILAEDKMKEKRPDLAKMYLSTCGSLLLQNPTSLAAIAEVCNTRKLDSRKASEDSNELFFTVFVKECGPLTEPCSVVNVLNQSFDVLILSTGIVKRVYLENLNLYTFEYEEAASDSKNTLGTGVLHLWWNSDTATKSESNPAADSSSLVLADPAVLHAEPADIDVKPPPSYPCNCFVQELRLFDLCRCLLKVEEEEEEEDVKSSSQNISSSDKPHYVPKIKATILRPKCALCEDYAS